MSKLVADSSVWIAVITRATGFERYLPAFEPPHELIVPAIVIYEVVRWCLRHRDVPAAQAAKKIMTDHHVLGIDAEVAVFGAELAKQHRLAMADALIIACAQMHGAELWSQDKDFAKLPGVRLFERL